MDVNVWPITIEHVIWHLVFLAVQAHLQHSEAPVASGWKNGKYTGMETAFHRLQAVEICMLVPQR